MSPLIDARKPLLLGAIALVPCLLIGCHSDSPDRAASSSRAHPVSTAALPPAPPQPSIEPPHRQSARTLPGNDGTLAAMVESALLAEPELRTAAIEVSAVEGTVFLRGKAKDRNARRLATQIATTVDGVKRVRNELFVTAGS